MVPKTWCKAMVLAAVLSGAAWAEEPDGPGRGVARIGVINGDVSVRRGDSGDWVAAAPNAPLVVEDRVLTGAASRAEVQFDWANFIRLAANTEIRLAELEYRRYQVQLAQGTATFRVLRDSEAEVEVSTPVASIRPSKRGVYRISVREDGQTEITARSGEVEVYTPKGVERLAGGRTMLLRGSTSDPEFQLVREIPEDDWDRWNVRRDRDLERSPAYRYVHRDVYGAEELDPYGTWANVDTYGWVWRPRVHVDWAPYRHGRWVWVDWYGWTWLSHDPWGWAPYHYGRWFHHARHGWCWYPGGFSTRHYWRPALVAFFGIGDFRVGVGFGRVGWVPLAPYERYYPWYGHRQYRGYGNRAYIDNSVNIVNNINIRNTYRNARIRNGITAVEGRDFVSGRTRNFARVSQDEIGRANLVRGTIPATPERASLRMAEREARVVSQRAEGSGRFYSRREPQQTERVPFERQRQGMAELTRKAPIAGAAGTVADASAARERGGRGGGGEGRIGRSGISANSAPAEAPNTGSTTGLSRSVRAGGEGADGRGWRRAGDTASPAGASAITAKPALTENAVNETGSAAPQTRDSSRWRRFDRQPGGTNTSVSGSQPVQNEGWRRSSQPGSRRAAGGEATSGAAAPNAQPAAEGGARSTSSPQWRRFGEPSVPRESSSGATRGGRSSPSRGSGTRQQFTESAPQAAETGVSSLPSSWSSRSSTDSSGWSRFGEPGTAVRRVERSGSGDPETAGGRGFDRSVGSSGTTSRSGRTSDFERRTERPRSIELSTPVIRERSSRMSESRIRSGSRGGFGGESGRVQRMPSGDGGVSRAPRGGSAPRMSGAPSAGRSGGGGGGSRGSSARGRSR